MIISNVASSSAWLLGICEKGFDDLKAGHIHWISEGKYKGKKWFADPYILDYNLSTIHILVEEFDYQVHRGRIAKLTVDRSKWEVTDCKILLDLDTHLSFPMIWREGVNVFVCPENYHSGGWNMYRYNQDKETLELVQQLSNEKLTDAIIWQDGKTFWIMSTYEPNPNGSKLTIWKSDSLTGPYSEVQRVEFDENVGRNAGMIFEYGDKLIRPAQESNYIYGHNLSFQEVHLKDGFFSFKEIYRFKSPHRKYSIGAHTYNTYNGMAVIDVKGYRYDVMGRILYYIYQLLVLLAIKKRKKLQ